MIAGGDSHTLHLRRARRVRDRSRLDRHRVVPRARRVLAGRARDDPGRARGREGQLRHRQGRDPRGDRARSASAAARTRRSSSSATGAEALSIDERLAVANMAVEAGSETGIFPADEARSRVPRGPGASGRGRRSAPTRTPTFAAASRIDLAALRAARRAAALARATSSRSTDAAGSQVDQVYIGNCANGTMTDLRQAADDPRAAAASIRELRAIVVPAIAADLPPGARGGPARLFVEAGAIVSTPTCGACFGGHTASSRPARTPSRRRTGTSGAGWARPRPASTSPTPGSPRPPRSPGEIVHPADVVGASA